MEQPEKLDPPLSIQPPNVSPFSVTPSGSGLSAGWIWLTA
jgi:hypothetical protein